MTIDVILTHEASHPLVKGRSVGQKRPDLARRDGHVDDHVTHAKRLSRVECILTVSVQTPDRGEKLIGMVGLLGVGVDGNSSVGALPDIDRRTFSQVGGRGNSGELPIDRRLLTISIWK